MPIAMESGLLGHGGGELFGGPGGAICPPACGGGGSSSSTGWGRDSRMGLMQCDDGEDSDGEVQSSYRGPLDTMDALQDALPRRGGVTKFCSFLANAENVVQSQCTKTLDKDTPPKKRKSTELNPIDDCTNNPTNCKKPLDPAVTNSSSCKKGVYKNPLCDRLQRAKDAPASPHSTRELTSIVTVSLDDVGELFDVISLKEKRRKG